MCVSVCTHGHAHTNQRERKGRSAKSLFHVDPVSETAEAGAGTAARIGCLLTTAAAENTCDRSPGVRTWAFVVWRSSSLVWEEPVAKCLVLCPLLPVVTTWHLWCSVPAGPGPFSYVEPRTCTGTDALPIPSQDSVTTKACAAWARGLRAVSRLWYRLRPLD